MDYINIKTSFILFLLIVILLDEAMALPFLPSSSTFESLDGLKHETDVKHTDQLPCGGTLEATHVATAINIPQVTQSSETMYCEWIIQAQHPSWRIGLAAVEIVYSFFLEYSFDVEVYDGSTSKDAKLWHGHEIQTIKDINLDPLTSSTDALFINYTTAGGFSSIEMKLIYYLCGGIVQNKMELASPLFDAKTTYDVPLFLQCNWIIEKPQNAYFGFIHLHTVNVPYCDALSIATVGGELISLEVNDDVSANTSKKFISNKDKQFAKEREAMRFKVLFENNKFSSNITYEPSELNDTASAKIERHASNETDELKIHRTEVCNESTRGIAFSGSKAVLNFTMFFPQRKYGFSAVFVTLRKPRKPIVNNTPWYFNYAPIAIYCPVGVIFGIIIICAQTRKGQPSTLTVTIQRDKPKSHFTESQSSDWEGCVCVPVKKPKSIMKSRDRNRGKTSKLNAVAFLQNNNSCQSTLSSTKLKTTTKCSETSEAATEHNLEIDEENSTGSTQESLVDCSAQFVREETYKASHLDPIEEKCESFIDSNDDIIFQNHLEPGDTEVPSSNSQLQPQCRKSVTFITAVTD